eukprot:2019746-Prymnesium_polylepis.1
MIPFSFTSVGRAQTVRIISTLKGLAAVRAGGGAGAGLVFSRLAGKGPCIARDARSTRDPHPTRPARPCTARLPLQPATARRRPAYP